MSKISITLDKEEWADVEHAINMRLITLEPEIHEQELKREEFINLKYISTLLFKVLNDEL